MDYESSRPESAACSESSETPRPSSASTPRSAASVVSKRKYYAIRRFLKGLLVIPKALCSISFIVLVLAICASLGPALVVWSEAVSTGLGDLQDRVLYESLKQRAFSVKTHLELNLESCESQLLGYSNWLNSIVNTHADEDLGVLFWINRTSDMVMMGTPFGGCAGSVAFMLQDGGYVAILGSDFGFIFAVQYGYGSSASIILYPYNIDTFSPYWNFPIPMDITALDYMAGLDSSVIAYLLETGEPYWSPLGESSQNQHVMTTNLLIAIPDSTGTLIGIFSNLLSPGDMKSLYSDSSPTGILCSFIQDTDGCLISSSCENATSFSGTTILRTCVWNSTVSVVVASQEFLAQALQANISSSVVLFQKNGLAFGYVLASTTYGFNAIVTVVADLNYFSSTYDNAKSNTLKYVIVAIVISAVLAAVLCVFTLLGQLQVIRRIRYISDISMGKNTVYSQNRFNSTHSQVSPEGFDDLSEPNTPKFSWHKFNIFGHLSEIALILKKLEWLEGKVQIVCAFIPVVAKLVCREDISDAKVLESKLSRRLGCYLFIDIEGRFFRLLLSYARFYSSL